MRLTDLFVFLSACLGASIAHADAIGRVLFVHGEASLQVAGKDDRPLKAGQEVAAGDQLRTGADGHVQLRFVDQAFVSLRPGSRLQVNDYLVDRQQPANNRVRFTLQAGTGRFVTGEAGEANKTGFRLNTPLAAVGIRGTDFVVSASDTGVRALVNRGGIVVSPFSSDCSAQAFGPCGGAVSRELSDRQRGLFIDVSAAGAVSLLPRDQGAADLLPATQGEPSAKLGQDTGNAGRLAAADNLRWGRWSARNDALAHADGYERVARNDIFALYRGTEPLDLPRAGLFHFVPTYVETYAVRQDGSRLPATLLDPRLSINFAAQTYATSFTWLHDSLSRDYRAAGSIDNRGVMQLNPSGTNLTDFYGLLAPRASSAAYIFEGNTGTDLRALGLVRWSRQFD